MGRGARDNAIATLVLLRRYLARTIVMDAVMLALDDTLGELV